MVTRPDRFPIWSLVPANTLEPPAGTVDAGYPYAFKVPRLHWNWLHNKHAAWGFYLDAKALQSSDLLDPTKLMRVAGLGLNFATGPGSTLAQRPNTGAVYIIGGERADMTATGNQPNVPVYTFAANSNNRVWARVRVTPSRSNYPETIVTQNDSLPGSGYMKICNVVTNATTVISVTEATVHVGLYWKLRDSHEFQGAVGVSPQIGQSVSSFVVGGIAAFPPCVLLYHADPAATNTVLQVQANAGVSTTASMYASGVDATALTLNLSDNATGAKINMSQDNPVGWAAGIHIDQSQFNHGIAIANATGLEPTHDPASPIAASARLFATTIARGGFASFDHTGVRYVANVSRGGFGPSSQPAIGANQGPFNGGQALITIYTLSNLTLFNNHVYDITYECEALNGAIAPAFVISVTLTWGGQTDPLWNAKALSTNTVPGGSIVGPWLSTRRVITYSGADTNVGTALIRIATSAGLGSVTFIQPRIVWRGHFQQTS